MGEWCIGVLGGSGLYAIDALEDARWRTVDTPWGAPSDQPLTGTIAGIRFAFLPRHGRGHRAAPSQLNYRANIDALKRVGCTDLIALSAVGSLREELPPGRFVVVDQFIDNTRARPNSFFGPGLVAHASMADPVCPRLAAFAAAAAGRAGAPVTEGGTYVAIEGPQFGTRAESHMYRGWGADVIGMTAMPEAKLAREAELPYALVAMVTDYDCWRSDEAHVDVAEVMRVMHGNAGLARQTVVELARLLPPNRDPSPIDTCLDVALVTAPEARDPALVAKLDAVAGRVLG
ncbi:S-methyl-5'-thioadenosine phosphorylase [Sphingomonas sp. MAH-20]|uniref:Purine nucleoside phosphorylase n=1 Tax=Sphingomonas horti TaxID=2682842 RepID=A0A6I4J4C6_9SPHN|nr:MULTISPECIES: S-methyl-5'-thioadenosine phosphorylase [Sphingomonas]MBA2919011.1 S-methyl-5'-thioadenosine phosphorylase [Sphingomonas sp. CGMCC 1.13658]MVO79044.1 S-methyl-5'-thioadenosine phosphorylase [Sphingomonas horti]